VLVRTAGGERRQFVDYHFFNSTGNGQKKQEQFDVIAFQIS
jgi:hypothetical protein